MKKLLFLLILSFQFSQAQIGDGWDWAFNTGSLGGTTFKHLKYNASGTEILMGGQALAAAYFGSTTLTAPPQSGYPGNIKFFGKINSATSAQTIIRSFINIPLNFDCITTDAAGNFYIGGAFVGVTDFDLGNGVIIPGSEFKKSVIAKFDAAGNTLWAKSYDMGTLNSANTQVFKLAVSNAGNIFFWGWNPGSANYPLFKLDANGNTIWSKNATGTGIGTNGYEDFLKDKFIDNYENVHLFVKGTGTAGFTFDGVAHPGGSSTYGFSTLISVNSGGNVFNAQTMDGGFSNFQVNRSSGNLVFFWNQFYPNPGAFQLLPHPFASVSPSYANAFEGMMETDKNLNFVKAKDYSTTLDNPFTASANYDKFLSLPNGKLIIAKTFAKTGAYSAGVNSVYPADANKFASSLIETDANWNIDKFISGGKAGDAGQTYITAFNDTYLLGAEFSAVQAGYSTTALPTTSFGTVNLTGFNAAPNMTTAYGTFSTNSGLRKDVAIVQCKSGNFPTIATTKWIGNNTNWNDPTNWNNGVPTNTMKALFDTPTANYPTVSTSPTAASLEVNIGVNVTLPATLVLNAGIKNEGTITINNAGFFQGLGSTEWKGNGNVNFTGSAVTFFHSKLFTNSLILNTNLTTQYDLNIPTISLNGSKVNLNNKTLRISNPNPTAISGANTSNYIYGGTIERKINPTGIYEFPMGEFSKSQTATINVKNLAGVSKLSAKYTSGAITGTAPNTSYNGVNITSALNGGWFTINPDIQPTSGTYDVTLKIQNSSNLSSNVANYIVIKRDNATSPWLVNGDYNLANYDGTFVEVKNTNLTTFSDFAIGKSDSGLTLGTQNFTKNIIDVYPNPTADIINISAPIQIKSVKIYDTTGRLFISKNEDSKSAKIEMSNYPSGLYLIVINLQDGTVLQKKVMKK